MTFFTAALLLLLLLTLGLGAFLVRSMFVSTRGRSIARYAAPRRALLVLDLQEGYGGAGLRPVTLGAPSSLIETVNALIARAAETGVEVAYVRQIFGSDLLVRLHGGRRRGPVVLDRRLRRVGIHDFEKRRTDAFSSRDLERLLIERQVDELFLVGVDAAYCVLRTAVGARSRGYRVTVVADAVRSRRPLAPVLERYRRAGIGVAWSRDLLGAGGAAWRREVAPRAGVGEAVGEAVVGPA